METPISERRHDSRSVRLATENPRRGGGSDDDIGGAISLTKRGRPVAVLVNRDDWEALQPLVRTEARDELRRHLTQVRDRVTEAGLDPVTVDEAIETARKVS